MREILFRGKRVDNGEWLESLSLMRLDDDVFLARNVDVDCTHDENYTQIVCMSSDENPFLTRVDTKSIGQYTGLKDKNDKKIFEGDIFVDEEDEVTSVVEFRNGMFCLVDYGIRGALMPYGYDESAGGFGECGYLPMDNYCIDEMEIDGNIHDNPELLKGA